MKSKGKKAQKPEDQRDYKALYENLSKRIGALHRYASHFARDEYHNDAFDKIDNDTSRMISQRLKMIAFGRDLELIK